MNARTYSITGIILVLLLCIGFLTRPPGGGTPIAPKMPMNVILISVDSLRGDHMGLFGYKRNTTPNIDAWAKDAMVFNNYFATSYLTPISEASVHTGLYPFSSGVINFESTLSSTTPTLAKILKGAGYHTAAFGSSPEFDGYPAGKSLSDGFDVYHIPNARSDDFGGRSSDPFVRSIPWIKQVTTSTDRPFFLWLPIGSVHWPYGLTEPPHFTKTPYDGFFRNISGLELFDSIGFAYKQHAYLRNRYTGTMTRTTDLTQSDYDHVIDRYDDGLIHTDRMIAKLFDYLKTSGLDKNTLIILQSEHGEGFGERGYVLHYDIYDEQVRTPLIIKDPRGEPGRTDALASGVDILPTTLSLLELATTSSEGVNLSPLVNGKQNAIRDEVFVTRTPLWERVMSTMKFKELDGLVESDDKTHYHDTAIRTTHWKLIHRTAKDALKRWGWLNNLSDSPLSYPEYELYDLSIDKAETHDIYDLMKGDPSIIALRTHLSDWEAIESRFNVKETPKQQIQPYF